MKIICRTYKNHLLNIYNSFFYHMSHPAGIQRPEDVPLWSYFRREVPDHNRTKIGCIRPLTYFGSAISGKHLASGNIEKFP